MVQTLGFSQHEDQRAIYRKNQVILKLRKEGKSIQNHYISIGHNQRNKLKNKQKNTDLLTKRHGTGQPHKKK